MYKRLWTWFFFFSVERDGCCSYEEPVCVLSPFYKMIVFGAASLYKILSYLQTWIITVAVELLETVEEMIWATLFTKVLGKFRHWLCAFGYECNIIMHRECPEIYLWACSIWITVSFTKLYRNLYKFQEKLVYLSYQSIEFIVTRLGFTKVICLWFQASWIIQTQVCFPLPSSGVEMLLLWISECNISVCHWEKVTKCQEIICRNLPLSASVPGEGEGNEKTEELRGE